MGFLQASIGVLFFSLFAFCTSYSSFVSGVEINQTARLIVDASGRLGQPIPETLFGIFFEEINHAGAGGLWAELVSNRVCNDGNIASYSLTEWKGSFESFNDVELIGTPYPKGFEAGGQSTPSNIDPWSIIGNESSIIVSTDRSSCFSRNPVALRMDVLCDIEGSTICPPGGVGIYNPGYWGMNIESGKTYQVVLHVQSQESVNLSISLATSDGLQELATGIFIASSSDISNWTKVELQLEAKQTDHNARLQLTTTRKGVIWFDQVSVMPVDTHNGHGFRKELISMLANLKPQFIRFPGGCFVEGEWLRNAFRWRETIGPWEERPGHFGDVWMYWTDDGLGYFEFLQLAEDLGAMPIWVVNNGISHTDQVATASVLPFIQDTLNSIEFARGNPNSTWGSVRAAMGHAEPFQLKYIAIGNEDCGKKNYRGNYLKFYNAIKDAYPDIKLITNCDGSSRQLDHPADMYDFHIYTSANKMFSMAHQFDGKARTNNGPKAFVSEYAVTGKDAGTGSLLAALAEAGFLIGVERNSDIIDMASYAPLFVNANDRRWNPDAIVFNSWQQYGTPSYWMQQFFKESSGATLLPTTIQSNSSNSLIASAITWQRSEDDSYYLRIKIVNFANITVNLKITVNGLDPNSISLSGSTKTLLTSKGAMDENSFKQPTKVLPIQSTLANAGNDMDAVLPPYSLTAFDLSLLPDIFPVYKSSI